MQDAASSVPLNIVDLDLFLVTPEMVSTAIRKLKQSYTPGPDGIPAIVYVKCCDAISEPLCRIFNKSFDQRAFPEIWKHSAMFPVFKKGDRNNVENYRGITSLSAGSKVFEIMVGKFILSRTHNYISLDQHGFMPGRSVVTNLLEFTSTCLNQMENRAQVDTVYTDLKAAFDKISHEILLHKIWKLGASGRFVSWLRSYLIGRTLRVRVGSAVSSPFSNGSGVPQGSNLGPLLFSLYINDAATLLGPDCKSFFADDAKIYVVVRTIEDCRRLQSLIDTFSDWCCKNKLMLSIAKCSVITFHRIQQPIRYNYCIDGVQLNRVEQVRDLGVQLDTSMTFVPHITAMITQANRQLGFVSKIARDFSDPYCLKSLFCALVRPILENASVIWTPYQLTWILRIERVQKRFIRLALRGLPWRDPVNLPPYSDRCRLLNLDTLEDRRKLAQVTTTAKIINGELDAPGLLARIGFRASRWTRNTAVIHHAFHRTSYGFNEPFSAMLRTFSTVEDEFEFGEPVRRFSNRVKRQRLL